MQAQPTIPIWHGLPAEIWLTIATIIAVILGPILAIQVEKYLGERRDKRMRQVRLFRELMVTRGTRLSARHVEALNGIQMEFSDGRKEKPVLDAWKLYMTHLNNVNPPPDWNVWGGRAEDLLTDLLYEMGTALAYNFEKDRIKREAYVPKHYKEIEDEQAELRRTCLAVLKGEKNLKVEVQENVVAPAAATPRLGSLR